MPRRFHSKNRANLLLAFGAACGTRRFRTSSGPLIPNWILEWCNHCRDSWAVTKLIGPGSERLWLFNLTHIDQSGLFGRSEVVRSDDKAATQFAGVCVIPHPGRWQAAPYILGGNCCS